MISSLDSAAQVFLRGMEQIQQRSQRAQRELTTGLRINTVSDAPDQIASLWQTRSELAQTEQIDTNLGRVKSEVDTAEGALQSAVNLMDRAQTLGAQGASGTSSPQTRRDLANELGAVLEQMVATANTTVGGRYIFSGDNDQQPPYSIDLTQATPIGAYQGSAATREVQHPDGSQFAVSKTAQDIFDSANAQQNVFVNLNNLRTGLLNNDQAAITAAMSNMQPASGYLNEQLAFYGTVQNRVASGIDFSKNYETQLQTQLSGIQDADLSQSITELQQAQTQQQAALASRAKMPRTSLFDFLG
ncbi:MAG TPA: flagellin [Bryobacteraceae bacterium]|nr:flagellin [Bryobacteraceae bacterium]